MKATEVTTGLTESNGSLLPVLWRDSLHVTCGLTACTQGSAPGPTLGNEYGKNTFYLSYSRIALDTCPFTKFEGGLHETDDDAVTWLWLESTATASLAK